MDPSSTPGIFSLLCSFALVVPSFGFFGPEKSHWGSGQLSFKLPAYFRHVEHTTDA